MSTGEIVPVRAELLTAAPTADVVALQQQFHDLCVALLDAGDYQRIGTKDFKKKSAWRKLAAAFNVSDDLLERTIERDPGTGRVLRAEYVVSATAPNGRHAVGVGFSSIHERAFSNPEHDIPATAHTRAKNRAFADLFGLGEVSAEEVTDHVPAGSEPGGKPPARNRGTRAGSGVSGASEPPAPTPAVEGTEQVAQALNGLPAGGKKEFRQWCAAAHLAFPPLNAEDAQRMLGELAAIAKRAAEDADAYGTGQG